MHLGLFVVLLLAVVFLGCAMSKHSLVEPMGGYGIISGLAYNNNAKRCFKNPHDPDDYGGYCTTIGKVTI